MGIQHLLRRPRNRQRRAKGGGPTVDDQTVKIGGGPLLILLRSRAQSLLKPRHVDVSGGRAGTEVHHATLSSVPTAGSTNQHFFEVGILKDGRNLNRLAEALPVSRVHNLHRLHPQAPQQTVV